MRLPESRSTMVAIRSESDQSVGLVRTKRRRTALFLLFGVLLLASVGNFGSAADSRWMPMNPTQAPSVRVAHDMAYDSESDRVILFGGETVPASNVLNKETWAYDLNSNTWENRNPSSGPTTIVAHAMAYDAGSDRVVLFGGWTGTAESNETWSYDYNTNAWTKLAPATSPPTGDFIEMAYDAESHRTILFGGGPLHEGGGPRDETWAYEYGSNAWTRMHPSTSPAARGSHGMSYDPKSDRVILFGGRDAGRDFGDTWTYDYNHDNWTRMSPKTSPTPRHGLAMSYDTGSSGVVLFGGVTVTGDGAGGDETWVYHFNGDAWTMVEKGSGPSSRYGAGMVYDTRSDRVVLFGGSYGTGTWTSSGWPANPPGTDLVPILAAVAIVTGAVAVVVGLLWRRRRVARKPG